MGKNLGKWIKSLRNGDQSAFLPFYEKVAPGLMRFLLWKTNGDRPLSEDILQESFVRFLLNLDRLESLEELSIQSYLLKIVKNCLIDKTARVPKMARYQVPLEAAGGVADRFESARQERAVEMRELKIAMESLNEKDSEIIWLKDAMGFSHREVANQVGISEQASRQAYVRAKRSLIEEFKEGIKNLSPKEAHGGTVV